MANRSILSDKPRLPSTTVTALLILLPALVWMTASADLLWRVPAAQRTFDDFQMKLPYFTQQVLRVSMWVREYAWAVVLGLLLPCLAVTGWFTWWLRHRAGARRVAWGWVAVQLVFPLAGCAVIWFALDLANWKLDQALGR